MKNSHFHLDVVQIEWGAAPETFGATKAERSGRRTRYRIFIALAVPMMSARRDSRPTVGNSDTVRRIFHYFIF
jgi:hypothetical protein